MAVPDQKQGSCRMTTHITFTGIYGEMRRRGREYVECLKAVYDGCLVLGVTTHVVCDPTRIAGSAPSEKLLLAVEAGLPVLSFRWLEKCAQAGRWIPLEGYTVALRAMQPATASDQLEPEAPEEGSTGIEDHVDLGGNENHFAIPSRLNSAAQVHTDDDAAFANDGGKIIKDCGNCNFEQVSFEDVSLNTVQHREASNRPPCEEEKYVALQHGMQRENKTIRIKLDNKIENERRSKPESDCFSGTATATATAGSPSSTALHLSSSGTRVDSSRLGALLPPANDPKGAPLSPSVPAVVFQPPVIVEAGPLVKTDDRWLSRKLRDLEAHHGVSLRSEQVKFYAAATVNSSLDKAQRKISIKASPFQGVNLLYDIDRVSCKTTYARAMITGIYSLETGASRNELWMGKSLQFLFAYDLFLLTLYAFSEPYACRASLPVW
jgi:hypothetical protein